MKRCLNSGVLGEKEWNGRSRSCDYKDQAIRVYLCVCMRVCVQVTSGPVDALQEGCSVDQQILHSIIRQQQ